MKYKSCFKPILRVLIVNVSNPDFRGQVETRRIWRSLRDGVWEEGKRERGEKMALYTADVQSDIAYLIRCDEC